MNSENEALRDKLSDAQLELRRLREALDVPEEPHQTLQERTLEAARSNQSNRSNRSNRFRPNVPTLPGESGDLLVDDLAAIIKRLIYQLPADDPRRQRVTQFLKRHGLISVLRAPEPTEKS